MSSQQAANNSGGAATPTANSCSVSSQPSPLQRPSDVSTATTRPSATAVDGDDNKPSAPGISNNNDSPYDAQTQLVLEFLKERGMNQAVLELTQKLDKERAVAEKKKEEKSDENNMDVEEDGNESDHKTPRDRFMEEEEKMRAQRTLLTKTTGGGYGYDRDSAWPVVQWGIPDTTAAAVAEAARGGRPAPLGVEDARALVDAFVHFQLWVLNLPDNPTSEDYENVVVQTMVENPILRAQKAIMDNKNIAVPNLIQVMVTHPEPRKMTEIDHPAGVYNLPPSVKPELLSVSFALFVHTYVDLLEVGMETTAQHIRDAFAPVFQPLYPSEFRDLHLCTSTEALIRLNLHNAQHMEATNMLKQLLVQISSYQQRKEEYIAHMQQNANSNLIPEQQEEQLKNDPKIGEFDKKIELYAAKYKDVSLRASQWYDKMHDLPFLRRARATRWILTISTSTYNLLMTFLTATSDDCLLPMSTLLQTKCTLQVERRNPLPYTPSCVLMEESKDPKDASLSINDPRTGGITVNWAVPAPRPEVTSKGEKIPFPKYHLEDEYETEKDAEEDMKMVQFNRALLINGFRRLEALERKREFEVLTPLAQKRARQGENISGRTLPNPLEPSILITTLTASSTQPIPTRGAKKGGGEGARPSAASKSGLAAIWEEPGIGICCSQACRLGRRVAAGCDDAAVRIYNMEMDGGEPTQVLIGHKNGFPVFDVDWNRDGRALLSAGGDGSVRLWDTMAVGPFGETTTPKATAAAKSSDGKRKGQGSKAQQQKKQSQLHHHDVNEMDMGVPGWRAGDPVAYTSGAAIAVYRGHAPYAPVWSVAFAPCGYYFCSAGADATARIWTTDRTVPVRLLSGHTASNVNCVGWHPNANYVVTGSDDKTARLWDIQTGQTVRLLTGAAAGINTVRISPGGRYCAGADYSGQVHVWDLGSGRKISVFKSPSSNLAARSEQIMLHSLSFSACGQALATGGDDCFVRIWDIRNLGTSENEMIRKTPFKSFATRRTVVMDLQYSKRNLLLAVGKYVSPVPVVLSNVD